MNKRTLFCFLLFFYISGVHTQNINLNDIIPFDSQTKIGTLPNGLKYYTLSK